VTQTAISHRLRDLEEQVGTTLFTRHARRLKPTDAAVQFANSIRASSEILERALDQLADGRDEDQITISMLPALASKWLVPQLSEIVDQIDNLNLRIMASRELTDFQDQKIDAAIRYGRGNWHGVTARHMTHEAIGPVMSPDLARSLDVTSNDPLRDFRLLRCDNPNGWEDWFAASGVKTPDNPNDIHFNEDATMIEAAISGHGVALGRFTLVAHDVRAGRLVAPFQYKLKSSFSYWFVQGKHRRKKKSVTEFFRLAQERILRDAHLLD